MFLASWAKGPSRKQTNCATIDLFKFCSKLNTWVLAPPESPPLIKWITFITLNPRFCRGLRRGMVASRFRRLVHFHPPFSLFLGEEKEKTGRGRSKREKDADKIGGKFWIGGMDNEKSITDLICFYFRCRCCWWLKWNGSFLRFWQQWRSNETGGHRDPPLQTPMQRQRG